MFTWETTLLIAPLGLGQSGWSPNFSDENSPRDCASIHIHRRAVFVAQVRSMQGKYAIDQLASGLPINNPSFPKQAEV